MDPDCSAAQRHLLPLFMDKAWKVGPMPASAFWEVPEIECQGKSMVFFNASTREPREGRDAGIYFIVKIKITENDCILSEYKV